MKRIGKYLLEISVVVIGVAITLLASHWIGVKNEKRDIALHLNAIKLELEENAKDIGDLIVLLNAEVNYTTYLRSQDKKSLNKDSLNSYFFYCYNVFSTITFKTSAFDMFKSSGTMRLMKDRETLLEIWDVYDRLTVLKQLVDEYNKLKLNFIEKEISLIDVNVKGDIELQGVVPMYDFYKKIGGFTNVQIISKQYLKSIEEVILKLNETEMIKPFKTLESNAYVLYDEDLDKYLGVYSGYSSDSIPLKMVVTKVNKRLFVQFTGGPPVSMEAIAENKFKIRGAGIILKFNPTDSTMLLENNGEIINFAIEK
jgi:hypothetical protein